MRRVMFAIVLACFGVAGSAGVSGEGAAAPGQASGAAAKPGGLPACDPGNGGLTLPPGFCALVVHEGGIGEGRHIVVNGNGDIYVILRRGPRPSPDAPFGPGGIVGLRDTNGDGKVDVVEKFGEVGGTGLELRNGYLYYAAIGHIGRFKLTPGELKPSGPAEIVVDGFPLGGGHAEKDITFDNAGNVYVNIGLPSNACQIPDRRPGAPGIDPCPQLEERGGIWRFKADVVGQKYTKEARYASGLRQPVALAWHEGRLYAAMNSRDSLDTLFPEKGYTAEDNAFGPAEPMFQIAEGDVYGWP